MDEGKEFHIPNSNPDKEKNIPSHHQEANPTINPVTPDIKSDQEATRKRQVNPKMKLHTQSLFICLLKIFRSYLR